MYLGLTNLKDSKFSDFLIWNNIIIVTRQVIKVRALVLDPIDPDSTLDGEFLEDHDFTSPLWKKQG